MGCEDLVKSMEIGNAGKWETVTHLIMETNEFRNINAEKK